MVLIQHIFNRIQIFQDNGRFICRVLLWVKAVFIKQILQRVQVFFRTTESDTALNDTEITVVTTEKNRPQHSSHLFRAFCRYIWVTIPVSSWPKAQFNQLFNFFNRSEERRV